MQDPRAGNLEQAEAMHERMLMRVMDKIDRMKYFLTLLMVCGVQAQSPWPTPVLNRPVLSIATDPPIVLSEAPSPTPPRADCLLVATENYHRIKKAASWSNILLVHFKVDNGTQTYGHAMVVWKITPRSHVFMQDSGGGGDLQTSSTFIEDVLVGLEQAWSRNRTHKYIITDGHFIL